MRTFGVTRCSVWADPDWLALTSRVQWFYLMLNSQPTVSPIGVLPFQPRRWTSLASDASRTGLTRCLRTLEEAGLIVIDPATEELWLRFFIRDDTIGRQVRQMVLKEALKVVRSDSISARCCRQYPEIFAETTASRRDAVTGPPGVSSEFAGNSSGLGRNGPGPLPFPNQVPSLPGDVDRTGDLSTSPDLDVRVARSVRDHWFEYDDQGLTEELRKAGIEDGHLEPYLAIARIRRASAALFEGGNVG